MQTSPYAQQKYRQIVNDEKEVTSMFMDVVLSMEDLIQQKVTSIEMLTEEAMHFKVGFKAKYGKKVSGRIRRMNQGTLIHVEHNQIKTKVYCTASVSKKAHGTGFILKAERIVGPIWDKCIVNRIQGKYMLENKSSQIAREGTSSYVGYRFKIVR